MQSTSKLTEFTGRPAGAAALPHLVITNGSIEALKWLALVLMTGDHVNKYLFNGTIDFLFAAGRLAMPLFVFVLAYNLSRPNMEEGANRRTMGRLALAGLLATPAFMALGGLMAGWWPLNILFTLLALVGILHLADLRTAGGYTGTAAVFLFGGAFVEFWWPALLFGFAVWSYRKHPSWIAVGLSLASLVALYWINGNQWALASIPVILACTSIDLRVPRISWFFYAYYPIHLLVLWLIRILMGQAGYLFF